MILQSSSHYIMSLTSDQISFITEENILVSDVEESLSCFISCNTDLNFSSTEVNHEDLILLVISRSDQPRFSGDIKAWRETRLHRFIEV